MSARCECYRHAYISFGAYLVGVHILFDERRRFQQALNPVLSVLIGWHRSYTFMSRFRDVLHLPVFFSYQGTSDSD